MKKKFTRLLSVLLAFCCVMPLAGAADVQPETAAAIPGFTDVPMNAWYLQLTTLVSSGRINGYEDGRFAPDAAMTVQEYIKILVSCVLSEEQLAAYETGGTWSEKYIKAGNAIGALKGFDCSQARLKRSITRAETAWLLAAFAKNQGETLTVPEGIERALRDYQSISDTYREAVGLAYGAGLVTGYQDHSYHPNDALRRCEAVTTIIRFLDKSKRAAVVIPQYDYSAPVPESPAVDDSFFADAVFFGNSQCDGFCAYSGLTQGVKMGITSLSVYNVWSNGREQYFRNHTFGKIYLLLGINEMGYGLSAVAAKYDEVLQKFQTLQPNADIYVQSLLPVCESKLSALNRSYGISNNSVRELNRLLQDVCNKRKVYFVNIYEAFVDSSGGLPASKCWDGVHMNVSPHKDWLAYLKTHTV